MGRMSELAAEAMWEDQYVPSDEEMKSAAAHHALADVMETLKDIPPEWTDLATLYKAEDILVQMIQKKLEGSR